MSSAYHHKVKQAINFLKESVLGGELKVTLAFSHQNEDAITISLAKKAGISFSVFTLDTYKLFEESLAYQKEIEKFFGIEIKPFRADAEAIRTLEEKVGEYGIFDSVELRKECCRVRKLVPLKNALSGYDAWISGIRIAQSITRNETKLLEHDKIFHLLKLNPIALFSDADVERYIKENTIPSNSLYTKGFKSIGCQPCTRAIQEGEDIRAGRWWWENPEHKECGLHVKKEIK